MPIALLDKARMRAARRKADLIKKQLADDCLCQLSGIATALRMLGMASTAGELDFATETLKLFHAQEPQRRSYALFSLCGPDGGGRAVVAILLALVASVSYACFGGSELLVVAVGLFGVAELAALVRIGELRRCQDASSLESGVRSAVIAEIESVVSRVRGDQYAALRTSVAHMAGQLAAGDVSAARKEAHRILQAPFDSALPSDGDPA